jgi:hypothetical protein
MPLSLKRQRPPSAPPWSRLSALLGLFAQEFDVVLIDNDDRIAPLAFVVDNLPHNDREFRPHFLMNVRWLGSSILQLDVQAIDPLIDSSFDGDTGVAAHGFELVEEAGKLKSGDARQFGPRCLGSPFAHSASLMCSAVKTASRAAFTASSVVGANGGPRAPA